MQNRWYVLMLVFSFGSCDSSSPKDDGGQPQICSGGICAGQSQASGSLGKQSSRANGEEVYDNEGLKEPDTAVSSSEKDSDNLNPETLEQPKEGYQDIELPSQDVEPIESDWLDDSGDVDIENVDFYIISNKVVTAITCTEYRNVSEEVRDQSIASSDGVEGFSNGSGSCPSTIDEQEEAGRCSYNETLDYSVIYYYSAFLDSSQSVCESSGGIFAKP